MFRVTEHEGIFTPMPNHGTPGRACRRARVGALSAVLTTVAASLFVGLATSAPAAAAPSAPSRFVPVSPCRLFDSRDSGAPVTAGGTVDVAVVSDECGVPSGATAAALTITATQPSGVGYATGWPAGATRPEASLLNYRAGESVANAQLLQLGTGGRISLFTLASSHLVVDVTGYFVPAAGAVTSGRFVPVETRRLVDTVASGRPAAGSAVRIAPTAMAEVPAGAQAVAVNITTTQTLGPGFFTAYAAGQPLPDTSVLNADRANQTRAAAAIVPISAQGFDVHTSRGDHVIVDIVGYFTGASAGSSTAGRFVANNPVRLVDTRLAFGAAGGPRLWDDGSREFQVTSITGGPVAAVSGNITITQTEDPGYVTATPARAPRPLTSSVNADAAQRTVANGAIVEVSTAGIQFTTLEATHLVVDISGWFTGNPVAATAGAPANVPPPDRKVTIISDSAMAGIRWNGALDGLQGMIADDRMESCRRLVQASCRGREGYAPRTVVGEINVLPAVGPEDILVIATGYDDWWPRFSSDFDIVMAAARAKGFHHVAWATFRSDVPYGLGPYYANMNAVLWQKLGSGEYPELRVWDLEAYTVGVDSWFTSDGIHQRVLGSWGIADWLSRHVRAFDDRPCPNPVRPGEAVQDPCPNPDLQPAVPGSPDIAGLYGL
jgi:hypothetical protein